MLKNNIIFHIDLNSFFASAEEVNDPNLLNKPVAVAGKTKRSVISSANYEARKYGVKAAMPVFIAQKLCKKLIIVDHKFHLYQYYSNLFFKLLKENFTNKIEIYSIDECYLNVTDLVNKNLSKYNLAKKIQMTIKEKLKLGVSIGISYNKFLAKMASDYKKPMGITIIDNIEDVKSIIWPQKIDNMQFVGKSSTKKLIENNINTIGDLANCENVNLLKNIFGKNWNLFLDQARGVSQEQVDFSKKISKSLSCGETFLSNTNDEKEIKLKIKEMTKELCYRLKKNNFVAKTLHLQVKFPNFKIESKSLTVGQYTNEYDKLIDLFLSIFKKNFLNQKIRMISIGLSNLIYINDILSDDLLDKKIINFNRDENKFEIIVEKINKKFSKDILTIGSEKLNRR